MPTEAQSKGTSVAAFLLAHQDDEFGVFQKILDELALGKRVVCIFMTSGTVGDRSSSARNRESLTVLKKLGVQADNVLFVGEKLKIDDGMLMYRLDDAASWLRAWIAGCPSLDGLYLPAWEGGHPDHDALHAVGVTIAAAMGLLDITKQSSLYNGYKRPGQLFNVMRPLPMNGPAEPIAVPWRNRIAFMRYCLSYPSQRRTWMGLFPFVLLHYVFGGRDAMQPVAPERLTSRPHEGPLYYERRQFTTWSELSKRVGEFTRARP
jgi:LmbE family N-acetylglucosaminyl deacetylase